MSSDAVNVNMAGLVSATEQGELPTSSKADTDHSTNHATIKKLACIMVGLPARGKTYISQRISRYLKWLAIPCKVFNVGEYRRRQAGEDVLADFFDPQNSKAQDVRLAAATNALHDLITYLNCDYLDSVERSSGTMRADVRVAIYDATNSTRARRKFIRDKLSPHNISLMFIESVCHEPSVILRNIQEVKISGPDYIHMDPEDAERDFQKRIALYEQVYETITETDLGHVKLINVGDMVVINRIRGWLQSRIVYFVMNLHVKSRRIFMSRHGESMFNLEQRIGGDADLSPRGEEYARALPELVEELLKDTARADGSDDEPPIVVWTSTLTRTRQTAQYLKYPKLQWKSLDELDSGVCDGMTYDEIAAAYPEDFQARDDDKFNYRYRGGESYRDLVLRLEPIIMELERQENILIIAHQAVIRALYAYFLSYPLDELPYIRVPLHSVICITPKAYGCEEQRVRLNIDAVDTHRPKPKK